MEEGRGRLGQAHRARQVVAGAGLLALALAVAPAGKTAGSAAPFRFVDVAARVGLTRVLEAGRPGKDHLLDSAGAGAAFPDFAKAGGPCRSPAKAAGGGGGEGGRGAFGADYDNDGWPDILVTAFGRNVLYRNLGQGRFENVAARVGLESPGWNTGAAFFDADGDGWLDLYIAQYVDCTIDDVLKARRTLWWRGLEQVAFGPFGLKGAPDHFFRNEKGRFLEGTEAAGLTKARKDS